LIEAVPFEATDLQVKDQLLLAIADKALDNDEELEDLTGVSGLI
jgi:hypothetical protein